MKRNGNGKVQVARLVRCAIYTRKSTTEGLEQDFNSLDAQREAAEAYIASQQHEGWVCLPDRYDDGGYTGANMERPALRRLFEDLEAERIDCVVVYKVDRLSRSLFDFAKIVERFEQRSVSFVSVTQHFNTTDSMGRLTLNILLSFAQFEREIISERTRDKIAAARRKGKWGGGHPLLGYDVQKAPGGSKLVVNEDEAEIVREIFAMWAAGVHYREIAEKFEIPISTLYTLMRNPTYIGKIKYKGDLYDGNHPLIIDEGLFHQVNTMIGGEE